MFTIEPVDGEFSICKLPAAAIGGLRIEEFMFLAATDREFSLVCRTENVPPCAFRRADGRRLFRFAGTLDFSLTGVLAGVSQVLAAAGIGIFAISTFDTDYILTEAVDFDRALTVLKQSGYAIAEPVGAEESVT